MIRLRRVTQVCHTSDRHRVQPAQLRDQGLWVKTFTCFDAAMFGIGAGVHLRNPQKSYVCSYRWRPHCLQMRVGLFAQIGPLAHLFSLLVPVLGERLTGLAMGSATVAAILGRSLVGWLMPAAADRRLVACASYGVQMIGSLLFILAAGDAGLWLTLGIALFGLGIGNATSLPPLIAQQEFSPAETARVVPLIVAIGQAGYAFAPVAVGLLRTGADAGGAEALFLCAAAIQLAAIACLLVGRRSRPNCANQS